MTEIQLDRLEQYGRWENLKLRGIPPSQNENTNEIVKKMASVKMDDRGRSQPAHFGGS